MSTSEDWKNVDFHALRKQQLGRMEDHVTSVKQDQTHFRETHTAKQLEKVEALQSANVQLQKELAMAVERKRFIFDDIDKENMDYAFKAIDKVNEKDAIRVQICEVENILRMLR